MSPVLPQGFRIEPRRPAAGDDVRLVWRGEAGTAPTTLAIQATSEPATPATELRQSPLGTWHWRAVAGLHRAAGETAAGTLAVVYVEPTPSRLARPSTYVGLVLAIALLAFHVRRQVRLRDAS